MIITTALTSALISVIYDWISSLDSGNKVCIVLFEIRKAFDSVPHTPLLQKLYDIGLNPYLLRWIENYLTNREQFTVVNGYSSTSLPVLSGVPQGSVLGPLLFIIYINDVLNQILPDSNINLFADDIALYRTINSPDDYVRLQDDIRSVSCCLGSKYLDLNASKCCYLLLSRKRNHSIPPPILILNDAPLKRVNSYKYLGILISSDLMWSSHISSICSKTRRLTGMLYRQFYKYSSPNTMIIRPHLEYACTAWDPFLKKDVNVLEDVQEFALRVCTKSWDLTYDALLFETHLPSLAVRRQQAKLCSLYSFINHLCHFPNAPLENRAHPYATRVSQMHALVPIPHHSNQYRGSFFPSAIEVWNKLSPDIQNIQSIVSFKHALRSL